MNNGPASNATAVPATVPITKVCSVCGQPIRRDRFMCIDHWRLVPTGMQVAVWRSFRAFQNRRTPAQGKQALAAYRAATDAATGYVSSLSTTAQEPFK